MERFSADSLCSRNVLTRDILLYIYTPIVKAVNRALEMSLLEILLPIHTYCENSQWSIKNVLTRDILLYIHTHTHTHTHTHRMNTANGALEMSLLMIFCCIYTYIKIASGALQMFLLVTFCCLCTPILKTANGAYQCRACHSAAEMSLLYKMKPANEALEMSILMTFCCREREREREMHTYALNCPWSICGVSDLQKCPYS